MNIVEIEAEKERQTGRFIFWALCKIARKHNVKTIAENRESDKTILKFIGYKSEAFIGIIDFFEDKRNREKIRELQEKGFNGGVNFY